MTDEILLGLEVGTGKEVYLPQGHNVVTGMTQLSGKTTTMEALVDRGDITAVAFLTKRGESGFRDQHFIQPYYQEQRGINGIIDWGWVESILTATMGEKMKIERSFIINACNGKGNMPPAHSLEDVYNNFLIGKDESSRGFDESIFTNLSAYFEIVLPEIKKHKFAEELVLTRGFNVMNLIDMPDQMQQLVIRATLEYIYRKLTNTVVIIPEAHKFIPDSNTPVKPIALRLIREGAAIGNYVWIDTQETASVDKALLKQVSNWIMGYQQEKNEVKNVREHLGRKVKAEDITSLKLGHFVASLRRKIYHVYVLPKGVPLEVGRDVAMGRTTPEQVRDAIIKSKSIGEEEMYREKFEELENQFKVMKKSKDETIKTLTESVEELKKECEDLRKDKGHKVDTVGLSLDLENANKKIKEYGETLDRVNKEAESLQNQMNQQTKDHAAIVSSLSQEIEDLKKTLRSTDAFMTAFRDIIAETVTPILKEDHPPALQPIPSESAKQPESVGLKVEQPILNISIVKKTARLELDVKTSKGKLYWLYANGKMDDQKINTSTVISLLEAEGWSRSPQIKEYLEEMASNGYLVFTGREARMTNYRVKLTSKEAMDRGLITVKEEIVG